MPYTTRRGVGHKRVCTRVDSEGQRKTFSRQGIEPRVFRLEFRRSNHRATSAVFLSTEKHDFIINRFQSKPKEWVGRLLPFHTERRNEGALFFLVIKVCALASHMLLITYCLLRGTSSHSLNSLGNLSGFLFGWDLSFGGNNSTAAYRHTFVWGFLKLHEHTV